MEAGRECVQVGKSGLDSHGSRPLLVRVQVFREISDHVLHGPGALKVSPLRRLRDFQDSPFGFVEYFVRRPPLRTECDLRDLGARPDETAKHRTFADDLRVRDDVRGVGGVLGEVREVGEPPRRFERSVSVEPFRHGHRIARLPFIAQARDRAEYGTMVIAVEVRGGDDVRDAVPGVVVDQNAAQHCLFGIDRMRRDAKRLGAARHALFPPSLPPPPPPSVTLPPQRAIRCGVHLP